MNGIEWHPEVGSSHRVHAMADHRRSSIALQPRRVSTRSVQAWRGTDAAMIKSLAEGAQLATERLCGA
jgi:hypothetical protein